MPAEKATRVGWASAGLGPDGVVINDDDDGSNAEGEDLEAGCFPFPLGLALNLVLELLSCDCGCGGGVGVGNTMERSMYRFAGEINLSVEVGSFARSGIFSRLLDTINSATETGAAGGKDKASVNTIRQETYPANIDPRKDQRQRGRF